MNRDYDISKMDKRSLIALPKWRKRQDFLDGVFGRDLLDCTEHVEMHFNGHGIIMRTRKEETIATIKHMKILNQFWVHTSPYCKPTKYTMDIEDRRYKVDLADPNMIDNLRTRVRIIKHYAVLKEENMYHFEMAYKRSLDIIYGLLDNKTDITNCCKTEESGRLAYCGEDWSVFIEVLDHTIDVTYHPGRTCSMHTKVDLSDPDCASKLKNIVAGYVEQGLSWDQEKYGNKKQTS